MSTRSSIEWTESTWNPLTGCTKVSPGCRHCYAERMSRRLKAMGKPNDRNGVFFFKQWGGVRKKRNGRLLDCFLCSNVFLASYPLSQSCYNQA